MIRLPRRTSQTGLDGLLGTAAAFLLPLGLLFIGLGWYGASHTPYLFEQVPYLISGGLVGLGLMMGAGLLYIGSWVARAAAVQERAAAQTLEVLREIRDGLGGQGRSAASTAAFVATQRGSMWHRPDCAVVAGRSDLRAVPADGAGLSPCALCQPLVITVP